MLYNGSWVIKCCTAAFGVKTIKVIDSVFRFDNERVVNGKGDNGS